MKFMFMLLAFMLVICTSVRSHANTDHFVHLRLEVCTDATGKKCVVQEYIADTGAFDTGITFRMQSELNLPVVGNIRVSGVVSSEDESIVDGYIRPVAFWNSQKKIWKNVEFAFQKHRLTVSKSLLFGNPQIASFALVVDTNQGVLLQRNWCTVPAGKQYDFYRAK